MTNKKIFRVLVLAAFAAMIVSAPLQATTDCQKQAAEGCQKQAAAGCQKQGDAEKMMGKGCAMGQGCMMLKAIPNLSDEQKGKLEKLHAEHQKLMVAAKADMEKMHVAMQGLMKDPVDRKKIEAKIDEAAKMKAEMMKTCLAHRLAVTALLTPEQKAKLGDMSCGMTGSMMHGQGCGKMAGEKMQGKCGHMKKEMKMDHSACQKAAEEKKEEKE